MFFLARLLYIGPNHVRWGPIRCAGMVKTENRRFDLKEEEVKRSIECLIKLPIKAGARVSYRARRWLIPVASASPLAHHFRAAFG